MIFTIFVLNRNHGRIQIMATSTFRNKNEVRPKKGASDRRRRVKTQKKRLISLGMPEEAVQKLQVDEIRTLLRHPKKVERQYAAQ